MIIERIKKFVSIYFIVKIQPPLEPILLQGHNLNKLKSILPLDCATQVTAYLAWASILINFDCLYQMMFCAKFGWIWSCGSEEKVNYAKVYRRTDRQTYRKTDGQTDARRPRWSEKLTRAFSQGVLKFETKYRSIMYHKTIRAITLYDYFSH